MRRSGQPGQPWKGRKRVGKRGWSQQGWLHCSSHWQPMRRRGQHIASPLLPYFVGTTRVQDSTHPHSQAARRPRCKLLAYMGLEASGETSTAPGIPSNAPGPAAEFTSMAECSPPCTYNKLQVTSLQRQATRPSCARARGVAMLAVDQNSYPGGLDHFRCLRSYRGGVPSPAYTKLGFPAIPAHIILQYFQG